MQGFAKFSSFGPHKAAPCFQIINLLVGSYGLLFNLLQKVLVVLGTFTRLAMGNTVLG